MKIIGLTGGIGSGKSTIAEFFRKRGIPVYVADERGRAVTDTPAVLKQIKDAFGESVFNGEMLDRKRLAQIVFNNPSKLSALNAIVHPAVREDFRQWAERYQAAPIVIRESAILFESGSYQDCDAVITVTAPEELRIERVMLRDQVDRAAVIERIKNQMPEAERISKSDFVIQNSSLQAAEKQAVEILKNL